MFLSHRLSTANLIDLCRAMRYSLSSGLTLREVMELLASKGTPQLRPVAEKILLDLKAGWSLQEALKKQEAVFPPLFLTLAAVGEESGNLPEVLGEMEKYYIMQQQLNREFRSQISWPVFQLVAAILIITGLIYILGIISDMRTSDTKIDPLGMGLYGTSGALVFLGIVAGVALILALCYWTLRTFLRRRAWIERILLSIPALGPCLLAIALTRFCIALNLMLETTLAIFRTFRLALLATDNAAFIAAQPKVEASLRQGNNIATSLQAAGVFPEKFLSSVAVAEESGRLSEMLRHNSEEYDDEARRRLGFLNKVASYVVWIGVAAIIITAIIRIFLQVYIKNVERFEGGGM